MTTNSCAVPTCDTGRQLVKEKRSVFRVPSNIERRQKWITAIPGISQLMPSQFVCEKHFLQRYILRKWVKHDLNGRVIAEVPYSRPRLDPMAVPSEFEDLHQVNSTMVAKSSIEEHVKTEHCYFSTSEPSTIEVENGPKDAASVTSSVESKEIPMYTSAIHEVFNNDSSMDCSFTSTELLSMDYSPDAFNDRIETSSTQDLEANEMLPSEAPIIESNESMQEPCHFHLSEAAFSCTTEGTKQSISIPKPWTCGELNADGGSFLFSYAVSKVENGHNLLLTQRFVKLTATKELLYYVYGRIVDTHGCNLPQVLDDLGALPHALERFKNMSLCNGLGPTNDHHLPPNSAFKDAVDMWRNNNCTLISKSKRCIHCIKCRDATLKRDARSKTETSLKRVSRSSNPIDQRKLIALRKKNARIKRLNNRSQKRLRLLQKSLQDKANEITSICSKTLADRCMELEIPEAQQPAIKEIIAAAGKKDSKSRRYGEQWIMLCLLMNIKSPSFYEFLRKNNILPLPCSRTIRHYFSLIDMKCGFDKKFATLLKKHLGKKTPLQRHGVILMDEINLRKSVTVCSKNLTYVGLTDFGDDGPQSTDIEDQATHGLVIMFQPLADSYTQPIAVFASKNPVKGDELAKLLIKAIGYLEEAGAKIHGVIADGAATNVKMWSLLGVASSMEDTKTWFTHPIHEDRKVFVFSDMPHVMKNIRNRLYNKKKLRINPSNGHIRWDYISTLFNLDTQHAGNARVCPKLTQRHIVLDNTLKMRVRLATQVFSNSVAQGLRFYLSHSSEGPLKGCEETIKFCKRMNDMFDALNRKTPNQGLTPGNDDFKILQDCLRWLNEWEMAVRRGEISPEEYLTTETSRGLRMSLTSTMDMCCYLVEKSDFQYLLTGKVNQDNLEKFFGTIRQAAGCNDHPNAPTFLQLYKLLCVYSILKPPKFGNCTVSEKHSPQLLVSLQALREVYSEKSEAKSLQYRREIQAKLEKILEHDDWEADDVIEYNPDHDYSLSPILDCIIYYVTGYLCKQVLKMYKNCMICQKAIRSDSSTTSSVSQLVDLKSRGGLIHANWHFFHLILHVEACFAKNASRADVFDCTLDEVFTSYKFTFPCSSHASEILSYSIIYYIRLRMRQNAHQENLKLTKKFVVKKNVQVDESIKRVTGWQYN